MSRHLRIAAAAALTLTAVSGAGIAGPRPAVEDMIVTYDQSQIMTLPRPAKEIIIGNATIVDVLVQGGTMLVVTGKTFGITNFIALDAERKIIREARVIVQRDEVKVVNLHKAGKRQSYNCTPQCNPMVTVGDDAAYFDAIAKSSQSKIKMSAQREGGEKEKDAE